MVNLIVDVSRYLMILLIAVYTWLNFRYFSFRDEGKQKKICGRQNRCMFLIHFLAYGILWLKTGDERILAFYVAQVVFFLCYIYVYRLFYHNVSRLLVNNMCMLLSVGFIILTRLSFDRALKQFVIVLAAAVITWIIPFIMDRVWQLSKIPWVYGILSLIHIYSDCSVTEIADRCGFGDGNYFGDAFRKAKGVSPRAFRKMQGGV